MGCVELLLLRLGEGSALPSAIAGRCAAVRSCRPLWLTSSATLRALEAARDRRAADDEFSGWVDQAIEDVTGRINE